MQCKYNVSEFYTLLKLGIWKSGTVHFWGQVDIPARNSFTNFEMLGMQYSSFSLIRKHLDTGLYLLDLFYIGKDMNGVNVYQLVVAVCRNDMRHLEALYHIQVSNVIPAGEFFLALSKDDLVLNNFRPRRKSLFVYQSRIRTSLSSNMPIGSRFIQHY